MIYIFKNKFITKSVGKRQKNTRGEKYFTLYVGCKYEWKVDWDECIY